MEKRERTIGFIGAGKVGCSLGSYFKHNGKKLSGYFSRSISSAETAAELTGSRCFESVKDLAEASDIIFVTTSDGEIANTVKALYELDMKEKIICHCSGALSTAEMTGVCFCLHPLLAVSSKESEKDFGECVFTIEGNKDSADFGVIHDLAASCGNTVVSINPSEKARYHAAAVFASNLAVGLYEAAVSELCMCGFDRESAAGALSSLFLNNAKNITEKGMEASLTGPVERGDASTVKKHLSVLKGDDREIYINLSRCVLNVAKRKNPDRDYKELEELL